MLTWPNLRYLASATGEVCPNAGALANFTRTAPQLRPVSTPVEPQGILEWAASKLDFTPSPKQAEILTSEAKYLILCCNRQWGKTTTIAAKALYAALQTPKLKIAVVARSKEQAGILIDNATEFAITLGLRTRRVPGKQQSLQLPNLSRIVAVPHTLHSSLGRTAHILIVDEAAKVTDEVYYAVSPFVSRTNGKIWLLSTPTRQTGFFYNFWHDTESNWHRVFSNVEDCPGIDRDYLAMQQRANPIRYSQDFLCQFVQPANRLCSREAATAIVRKKGDNTPSGAGIMSYVRGATVIPESKVYYGLDLGQRFDHSAFVAVELAWRHRGKDPVHFSERYQPELKITALTRFPVGLDYGKVHQMVLAALPSAPRKARLVIDAGGPGPPVVDRLRSALPAHIELKPVIITGGKGHNTLTGGYTGIPRRSLISTLLMAMVAGTLIVEEGLPNWEQLVDELVELSAETTHPIGGAMHDDLVMALALAVSAAVRDTPSLLPNHPGEPDKRTHPRLL